MESGSNLSKQEDERIKALALVLRAISHETRLKIMNLLNAAPKTWTQMQLELQINPKSLRDHLKYLVDRELVKKVEPIGFELSHVGNLILEISMKEMLTVIENDD